MNRPTTATLCALVVLAAAGWAGSEGPVLATDSPRPAATTTTEVATAPAPTTSPGPVERSVADASLDHAVGEPISISIPEIGVAGPLVAVGLLDDGTIAVPEDPSIAGWFSGGPRPGEQGPAVIMGHVDSRVEGPGVFYRLVELPVGAIATVETTTGPQRFVVVAVEQYPKDQFPTDLVYGAQPGATLRLITCGGSFDSSIRHYRDNIIAFLVKSGD